jgi:hypothetical protein
LLTLPGVRTSSMPITRGSDVVRRAGVQQHWLQGAPELLIELQNIDIQRHSQVLNLSACSSTVRTWLAGYPSFRLSSAIRVPEIIPVLPACSVNLHTGRAA